MLSQTLSDGLAAYRIGEKIRSVRLKKKMGLVELGNHSGLSPALLSKIERGKLFPTLPTLMRIGMVFSLGLDYFFRGEAPRPVAVVRKGERKRFPERIGWQGRRVLVRVVGLHATERSLSAYLAEFETEDPAQSPPHAHPGSEFLYVLSGRLALRRSTTSTSSPRATRRTSTPAIRIPIARWEARGAWPWW